MKLIRFLKPLLFLYEVIRIIIIAVLVILKANDSSNYMMVIFAVQGALFPIMTLFLCVNAVRYREYIPLYIAGKAIGVFAVVCWLLFSRQVTMIEGFVSDIVLGSFDLLAIAVSIAIKDDVNNPAIDNMLIADEKTVSGDQTNTEVN